MYFLDMIKDSSNRLYIGRTKNPNGRLHYHNSKQGAKSTKYIPDFKIVFLEQHINMSEARKREVQIKKWRREKKEVLIERYQKGLPTKR